MFQECTSRLCFCPLQLKSYMDEWFLGRRLSIVGVGKYMYIGMYTVIVHAVQVYKLYVNVVRAFEAHSYSTVVLQLLI